MNKQRTKKEKAAYMRDWRKKNKVPYEKYKKKYYKNNKGLCKQRTVSARRKRESGMSPEYYDAKYKEQQGRCAICGIHQSEMTRVLNGDHSHVTGKLRGLLCGLCNPQLGYYEKFINDKDLVESFDQYLKMYK